MSAAQRPRLLVFGYLPPPYFGPSTAYQTLLQSQFSVQFEIKFVDLTVSHDVADVERFRWRKIGKLVGLVFQELWLLLRFRFDACLYPFSLNRNAFLKDAVLLGLARLFGVPTVLWAHGNSLPDFRSHSPRWLQRIIDATVGPAVAGIVLGDRLRFNFDGYLPADRVFVVALGIAPDAPPPSTSKRSDGFTVLYLSNLVREKGLLVLLEAVGAVIERRADARFVFAGAWWREEDRRDAERIVQERNISHHVEFVGVVTGSAKQQLLATADVLALPTFYWYEAHPNVLLEALQAGLPVIATPRGAIPEIIQDGVNGLLVREQDPADLAEKILRLAGDPALRERMRSANRERFASHYTREQYGQRMIAVFEEVLRRQ